MTQFRILLAASTTIFLLTACEQKTTQETVNIEGAATAADYIFINGGIYTVDTERSWAQAVAIRNGIVVYVGDNAGVEAYLGETTLLTDLTGHMMLPGFHDSHNHLLTGGIAFTECNLLEIETLKEIYEMLGECTLFDGLGENRWIRGAGWDNVLWPQGNPNKFELDEFFPDRPAFLESLDGHSAWVNSKALEIAGIDNETPNPHVGIIERDPETGEATGTLRESAMDLIKDLIPQWSMEQRIEGLKIGIQKAHEVGITAIIEPGLDEYLLSPFIELADTEGLELRVRAAIAPTAWQPTTFGDELYEFIKQRDKWRRPNLDVDSVKIYMDGVIEAGTGVLLEPYLTGDYGVGERYYPQNKVDEYLTYLDKKGIQVVVHAIGDSAVRIALDGFEAARTANGVTDNRHHIVHLQLIHPDDRPRFGELGVAADFQAIWAYPDTWVTEMDMPMIGRERVEQMYPIGSVHRSGGMIVGGSDWWVSSMNPLDAIEVAITRQDPWTNEGPRLQPEETVALETMIEAYTINGAYLMALDDEQGSIEVGKRADLVVLDRNLFEIPPSEINDAKVVLTLFDGDPVFSRAEGGPIDTGQ